MKYVRLEHPAQGVLFAFGLAPQSHQEIAAPYVARGYRATSAGFIHFGPACGVRTLGHSESLRLEPACTDAARIQLLYASTLGLAEPLAPSATP